MIRDACRNTASGDDRLTFPPGHIIMERRGREGFLGPTGSGRSGNMGIYVNPGNILFQEAINSKIYVDKSELISYTNSVLRTQQKNLCVSRPRRFGKSMAADMLVAYYSRGCDSRQLFSGLKIERDASFESHLNRHNVIRWDVQQFLEARQGLNKLIGEIERAVIGDLRKEFPECGDFPEDSRLKTVLKKIYGELGGSFVFVIDEWDCIFRIAKEQTEIQKAYLDFLRGLFKGAEYVELVYMTGILPIKKYGEHSALNIFDEYSMIDSTGLETFFGFTEDEVHALCTDGNVEFREIEKWYDGYLMNDVHIYNPKSVVDAIRRGKLKSYWTGSETYEALKVYIELNFDGLKEAVASMLGGGRCKVNPRRFQNDMTTFSSKDDVFILLVHLGYLTFDEDSEEVFIPNLEIEQEFLNVIDSPGWSGLTEALNRSEELLRSTWALDGEAVAEGMSAIHNETASLLRYNNENSLACTVLMAYYSAKAYYMNPIMELPSGKGFADVAYLPKRDVNRPALVVELKWNRSAEGAIKQIKDRQYASWIQGYTGDILLIGINYDKKTKEHTCQIEIWNKEN